MLTKLTQWVLALLRCDGRDWSAKCIWIGFALIPLMKCYGYKQCVHFLHGLLRRWWDPISLIKKLLAVLIGWHKNSLGMTRAGTSIFLTETCKNCIKYIDSRRWKSAVTAADCCSFHIDDGKYFHIEIKIVSTVLNSLYGHNFVKLWALYGCFFVAKTGALKRHS